MTKSSEVILADLEMAVQAFEFQSEEPLSDNERHIFRCGYLRGFRSRDRQPGGERQ